MASPTCAYCQSPIEDEQARTTCHACLASYHADCWQENGGCGIYGCTQAPAVEPRKAVEIPVSFWGQESKPCPSCGREILAAALRCRHCGTTFASAQPEAVDEFQRRVTREGRLPQVRRAVAVWFVLSVLPCAAPVAAVGGTAHYRLHREEIAALPSIYGALAKLGIGVSIAQTMALVIVTLLYGLLQGS
ncbi:MAG: hypothetical protein HY744_34670 [Deltaproteobacteria bacterium]|nr:hypothetical protein [Deltaproteobacteria bacterium]